MSVKKLVSSRRVISRLFNSYKIDNTDWIPRAAVWIQDALFDLKLIHSYVLRETILEVEDYKVEIPDGVHRIEAVSYNGVRLDKIERRNITSDSVGDTNNPHLYTYQQTKDGYLLFGFQDGDVKIYYISMDLEENLDPDDGENVYVNFPLIPEDSILEEALGYYILFKMLQRGFKHNVFSLTSQNIATNPYSMWITYRKKAQNSVSALSFDDRMLVSNEIKTLFSTYDYVDTVFFNKETS